MLPVATPSEPPHARTLTERWLDRYRADLLARLEWELDAGWRTVTDLCPQDHPQPVHVRAENIAPVPVRSHRHLWAVA